MNDAVITRFAKEVKRREGQKRSGSKAKFALAPAIFDSWFTG